MLDSCTVAICDPKANTHPELQCVGTAGTAHLTCTTETEGPLWVKFMASPSFDC